MKTKLLTLAALLTLATGCVTGKGWQGLIPDKDVDLINPIITLMTPYGQQTVRADRISTRVNPAGNNPLSPLPNPNVTNQTVTLPISTNLPTVILNAK